AAESALGSLCDFHDSKQLLTARDTSRLVMRLVRLQPSLTNDTYPDLTRLPGKIRVDRAYAALPFQDSAEAWWRTTLREALLTRLLLPPAMPDAIKVLADALLQGVINVPGLPKPQPSPAARMHLLARACSASGTNKSLTLAIRDTVQILNGLISVRPDEIHPENIACIDTLGEERDNVALPAHIQLKRLARNIGTAAVAQRRQHHTPVSQRLPRDEALGDLFRRASNWNNELRTALQSCLLLGRIGRHILRTGNADPCCHIAKDRHEVWIERRLPEGGSFRRKLEGEGFLPVARQLHLSLPRKLGHAVLELGQSDSARPALQDLETRIKQFSQDSSHSLSVMRLASCLSIQLEDTAPDTALMTLLGMMPDAGRDAAIHYFSPAIIQLHERFRHTVQILAERWCRDALADGWSVPPPPVAAHFGYSYRADPRGLHALITLLRKQGTLSRGRRSKEQILDAYNSRVALIAVLYLASTGARPTGTLLPLRSEYSQCDRAAVASEKDSTGYRSTRLVPVVDRLAGELEALQRWSASKGIAFTPTAEDQPLFVLRSPDGNAEAPTIDSMKRMVPGFAQCWVWPNDVLRHEFRSRLWELGCPSQWLRRVMAHHPPHASADVPLAANRLWHGLHDWDHLIDRHLDELGF
ncbi:MAG TPA: hypothetical protein PLN31_20155, partial [Azoarcus taiwanensis]|nr:hypothetical protein [Azoarcus taiwanensis]